MHYMTQCSCGKIISQCRCIGNKKITIIEKGCDNCHINSIELVRERELNGKTNWKLKKDGVLMELTYEDLDYLSKELHELFHGDD